MKLDIILEKNKDIDKQMKVLLGSIAALIQAQNEVEVNNEEESQKAWIAYKYKNIKQEWNKLDLLMKPILDQVQNNQ
jgi:hypothetical protein